MDLVRNLEAMQSFWSKNSLLQKCLISAYYIKVAAKSNRIQGFFSCQKEKANDAIVGAKFSDRPAHIITYFVSLAIVKRSIDVARQVVAVLNEEFEGNVDAEVFNDPKTYSHISFDKYGTFKSTFQQYVVDAYYVERFGVEPGRLDETQNAIVTLYDTGNPIIPLLKELGVDAYSYDMLDDTTVRLNAESVSILMQKAPYLVAMGTTDISKIPPSAFHDSPMPVKGQIPMPGDEPVVGVIDTLFDERVYFHKWVTYERMVDPNISADPIDYRHGTEVSSIIVDGPSLNPNFDDGCGRFRVRHFGVATHRQFSSFEIIRDIKQIVAANPDIHVWNLSLGSETEVNKNFVSAEGAILDQIQYQNNVIFVIAGTNNTKNEPNKRIGAPADSINSVVVNSVDRNKRPASYTRRGMILSFFTKPDVSYYGGVRDDLMHVVEPLGEAAVGGTSFAAPWISRKLAYLIEVMGLSREVAKALLMDSAIGWHPETDHERLALRGNGVVPVNIQNVLRTADDEIKFVLEGSAEQWDTYNYELPVPVVANKQPFIAKATLCYFPKCSRNQGVDYTNTELDLYFGRIDDKGKIKSINENVQSTDTPHGLKEADAREQFRKWDNVKHIGEVLKPNLRPRKAYQNALWAISIKTKERLSNHDGENIRFGIVVTLKEMNGVNRIDDFIQQASLRGWLVNRIDVTNRVDIYNQAQADVELE
ncbi:putative aaa - atpase [Schleiferilactobacillus perolens DSM 12744]|uniref:Putative aaa-atpase n=2 Tax=Schleiferilactobacillus perolens TaxID=100468 RepID=A0A0R1N2J1_9LACO|nr:putative aaa - atpase [Schleiferilactobacillus perolens DSM 12744]